MQIQTTAWARLHDCYPDLTIEDIHACLDYAIALVAAEEINLAGTWSRR